MANEEQLSILKQGAQVWNKWRMNHHSEFVDLTEANLNEVNLTGASLSGAYLVEANFKKADLSSAILVGANLVGANLIESNLGMINLSRANLSGADLSRANIIHANLEEADFTQANLTKAKLNSAHLTGANLTGANLTNTKFNDADLTKANLTRADFTKTILTGAEIGSTIFGETDLSKIIGFKKMWHSEASTLGTNTIYLSKGKIPIEFLRGCGLSDADIEYAKLSDPELDNEEINELLYRIYDLRATQAIQVSPLFISYSHKDSAFVDKIESHLNKKGVRFWRDVHDAKAGRLEKQIDRAMRLNPTVLLILSKHSTKSDWVEHEVRTARELEKEMRRDVLCPVALDDSWKNSSWPKRVMEQVMEYNILDFSSWKSEDKFGNIFNKLIGGLELFYK